MDGAACRNPDGGLQWMLLMFGQQWMLKQNTSLLLLGLLLVLLIKLVVVDKKYFPAASLSQPGKPPLRLPPGPWHLPVISAACTTSSCRATAASCT